MLRLISFILALAGLAVSALGIWLMDNELPTDLFAGEEPQLERKIHVPERTEISTDDAPETEAPAATAPPPPPPPPPAPVAAEAAAPQPEAVNEEAFEAIEEPIVSASPQPVQVMPTPKKDTSTGLTTRSLSTGGVEIASTEGERQPASVEPPPEAAEPPEDMIFDVETFDFDSLETAAGPAPAPTLEDQLYTVPIAYETPASAAFNSPFTVTLAIDARDGSTTATGGLSGSTSTNIAEAEVQVSDLVRANLVGIDEAFDVVPQNDKPQKLSKTTESVWRWKVTPLKTGAQRLKFEIFAVNVNNIEERLLSFDDTVTVEVSRIGQAMFLAQKYDPIVVILAGFGSLLAGIFGVLRFFKS